MDILSILQFLTAIGACLGVLIVACHKIYGFYILTFFQIIGIIYYLLTTPPQYWLVIQMIILSVFNLYGAYNWTKKGVGK
jgi:multisubunit Na+/H+ antiporter MnhG subunit